MAMRNTIEEQKKELNTLRSQLKVYEARNSPEHDRKEALAMNATYLSNNSTNVRVKPTSCNRVFDPLTCFAEPTEAEYLRNILYRYMTERENLGREIVVSTLRIMFAQKKCEYRRYPITHQRDTMNRISGFILRLKALFPKNFERTDYD